MNKPKAIFLDRDGTLIEEKHYLNNPKDIILEKNVLPALKQLHLKGFLLFIVTNQSGIARGFFSEESFKETHQHLIKQLLSEGVPITATFYCPHHPSEGNAPYVQACSCRKPQPGLLYQAKEQYDFDFESSVMIGDKSVDIGAGKNAGLTSILVQSGYGTSYPDSAPKPDYIAKDLLDAVQHIFQLP